MTTHVFRGLVLAALVAAPAVASAQMYRPAPDPNFVRAVQSLDLRPDQRVAIERWERAFDKGRIDDVTFRRDVRSVLGPQQISRLDRELALEHGVAGREVSGFVTATSPYNVELRDGTHIVLHNGTVIDPTGTRLAYGQRVHAFGYWADGAFHADRVAVY